MSDKATKKVKFLIFIIILVFSIYVSRNFSPERIRNIIDSWGIWGPLAYILLIIFLPIGFFPIPVLALAGGLAFGFIRGTVFTMIGAVINMALMFYLARFLFRKEAVEFVCRYDWGRKFMSISDDRLDMTLLMARVIPIVPYNIINYASGLTNISFQSYNFLSIIGIIPGTLVYLNMGNEIMDVGSPGFWRAVIILVLLTIVTMVIGKIYQKNLRQKEEMEVNFDENN